MSCGIGTASSRRRDIALAVLSAGRGLYSGRTRCTSFIQASRVLVMVNRKRPQRRAVNEPARCPATEVTDKYLQEVAFDGRRTRFV